KGDDAKGHYELALWCRKRNLSQYAKEELQKAIEINQTYKEAHLELARLLIEEGSVNEAIRHLEEITKNNPEDIEAKDLKLRIFQKWPKVEYYMKAEEVGEKDAEGHYQLGIFCFNKDWFKEAREEWKKVIEIDTTYNDKTNEQLAILQEAEAKVVYEAGVNEVKAQRYKESIPLLQKVIQEYSKTASAKEAEKMLMDAEGKIIEEQKVHEEHLTSPVTDVPSGDCMAVGPWEIRAVSFESARSHSWNAGVSRGTFEPKPPSDRIALVRIKGKATRPLTSSEKARIQTNLNKGSDLGKFAMMLHDVYKSKAFISNHFFALTSVTNPRTTALSLCHWIESKQGLTESTTYDKDGKPSSYFGYVSGDFEAVLIFAHSSTANPALLIFLPYGDENSMSAASIQTDTQNHLSVRYGTVEELKRQPQ
ncbi:MAG: tetratricopeptide repeat protein, partial [Ignavibacteriae bacterium]|nr:tetratricopeptide repeat protein [Ignavibacteriota bacterium]